MGAPSMKFVGVAEAVSAAVTHRRGTVVDVHIEGSIVIVFFEGKFAGVGVDTMPSRPDEHSWNHRKQFYRRFGKGGPLLLDWSPWFVEVCSQRGMELAS